MQNFGQKIVVLGAGESGVGAAVKTPHVKLGTAAGHDKCGD